MEEPLDTSADCSIMETGSKKYRSIINKIAEDETFVRRPCHLMLSQNKFSDVTKISLDPKISTRIDFQSTTPSPLTGVLPSDSDQDPALQIILKKIKWKKHTVRSKKFYAELPNKRKINYVDCKASMSRIPLYLLDFAIHLKEDPDPYFDSWYNWYMSGQGNLTRFQSEGKTYLVKSVGNTLHVNLLTETMEEIAKQKYTCKTMINETIVTDSNTIGLREKLSVTLLKYKLKNGEVRISLLKTKTSGVPLTSFGILDETGEVFYSCADDSFHIFNIENDSTEEIYSTPHRDVKTNLWSRIQHFKGDSFVRTAVSSLDVIDRREKCNNVSAKYTVSDDCLKISTSRLLNENHLCTGTVHNVSIYDTRLLRGNRSRFVKSWSHGLKTPPLYLEHDSLGGVYFIITNGASSDECCFVTDSDEDPNLFPWHLPTVLDTFKAARLKGYCLFPTRNLTKRLNFSRTGNLLVPSGVETSLFTLNSCGDTFRQTVSDRRIDRDVYAELQAWAEKIPKSRVVTCTRNVRAADNIRLVEPKKQRVFKRNEMYAPNESRNGVLRKILNCTDVLSQDILFTWQ